MSEKRFFIDKIDNNQYAVYDRLKVGYIEPLVYTDCPYFRWWNND